MNELKTYCRENKIKGYSKYSKKQDLLDFVNKEISDKDAALAKQLYESEQDYFLKLQNEEIQKQKDEILKEESRLKDEALAFEKMMKMKQNDEYEMALKEDLKRQEEDLKHQKEEELRQQWFIYKEVRDKRYAEKISTDDLEIMRKTRLSRFS